MKLTVSQGSVQDNGRTTRVVFYVSGPNTGTAILVWNLSDQLIYVSPAHNNSRVTIDRNVSTPEDARESMNRFIYELEN